MVMLENGSGTDFKDSPLTLVADAAAAAAATAALRILGENNYFQCCLVYLDEMPLLPTLSIAGKLDLPNNKSETSQLFCFI